MEYKSYPNKKTTASRRARKGQRNSTFRHNKSLRAVADRARRAALAVYNS